MSVGPTILVEITLRWVMNEDAMATEKLGEGIRAFAPGLHTPRRTIGQRHQ
jgi:hypothetical protein